jgi:hypothetical protein
MGATIMAKTASSAKDFACRSRIVAETIVRAGCAVHCFEMPPDPWATSRGWHQGKGPKMLDIGLPLMDPGPVVSAYAKLCAALQDQADYRQIGQNDLWIAATCLAFGKPLATRNRRHFGIIDGLRLEVLGP